MKVINLKNKIGCMCVVILALFVGVVLYNRYFNNIVKSNLFVSERENFLIQAEKRLKKILDYV